jgi:hypothetical protein
LAASSNDPLTAVGYIERDRLTLSIWLNAMDLNLLNAFNQGVWIAGPWLMLWVAVTLVLLLVVNGCWWLGYGVGVLPRPTSRYSRANPLEKHLMRRKLGFSVMMGLIGVTLLLFAHHLESLVR